MMMMLPDILRQSNRSRTLSDCGTIAFPMDESRDSQAPPRVSVIIVASNNAEGLRRSLTALEASASRETFEIIVADNGSQDDCPRMDAEFPAIDVLRLPRNFGEVKALNIGMRTAVGEFFFFIKPGMEVAPDTIPLLVERLDAAPDAVTVCPLAAGPAGEIISRVHPLPLPAELQQAWREGDLKDWTSPDTEAGALEVDYIKPPAMMVRGNFLKGLRYIDERYGQFGWDLELCTQIRRASKKILLLSAAKLVVYPAGQAQELDSSAQGLLAADRALGAAVWTGKHYGAIHGLRFRLAAIFHSLGQVLLAVVRFRDVGLQFSTFGCLLSGQKVDGSQTSF